MGTRDISGIDSDDSLPNGEGVAMAARLAGEAADAKGMEVLKRG